jgi:hypothetical protein
MTTDDLKPENVLAIGAVVVVRTSQQNDFVGPYLGMTWCGRCGEECRLASLTVKLLKEAGVSMLCEECALRVRS